MDSELNSLWVKQLASWKIDSPYFCKIAKNYEHLFKGALEMTLQKDFWIVTQGPFKLEEEEDVLEQIYQFHNLYLRGWMLERITWFAVKL